MKDIMEELKLCIDHEHEYLRKDASRQAVGTSDQSSTDNDHKYVSDSSSNGDNHMFPEFNSGHKAELEAQLILSADRMR